MWRSGSESNAHFEVQSLASYRWTTGVVLERLEGFKPPSSIFAELGSIRWAKAALMVARDGIEPSVPSCESGSFPLTDRAMSSFGRP